MQASRNPHLAFYRRFLQDMIAEVATADWQARMISVGGWALFMERFLESALSDVNEESKEVSNREFLPRKFHSNLVV